jgi:hypothetical protein
MTMGINPSDIPAQDFVDYLEEKQHAVRFAANVFGMGTGEDS